MSFLKETPGSPEGRWPGGTGGISQRGLVRRTSSTHACARSRSAAIALSCAIAPARQRASFDRRVNCADSTACKPAAVVEANEDRAVAGDRSALIAEPLTPLSATSASISRVHVSSCEIRYVRVDARLLSATATAAGATEPKISRWRLIASSGSCEPRSRSRISRE